MNADYREVVAGEVPSRQRRLADITLAIVSRDLDLRAIAVCWFRPQGWRDREERRAAGRAPWTEFEGASDLDGMCWGATPDTIWIRVGLDVDRLMETVAHEARHAWQRQRAGRWVPEDNSAAARAAREADATAYGRLVYRWFV